MNQLLNEWLKTAKQDLESAKSLKGSEQFSNSIYHLQQSFEKILKCYNAHLLLVFESATETQVESKFISLSHFTKKSALELLLKICELEDKKWAEKGTNGKIHNLQKLISYIENETKLSNSVPPKELKTLKLLYQYLESFKQKISIQLNEKTDIQNILRNYPAFINKQYTIYRNLEPVINKKEKEIIEKNKLGINNMSEGSRRFQYLIKIGRIMADSLSQLESLSRYPSKKFDYKNVEMLNRSEVKTSCSQLIEMLDHLIRVVEKDIS